MINNGDGPGGGMNWGRKALDQMGAITDWTEALGLLSLIESLR